MKIVNLAYIEEREEGGFDTVNDWYDVLSGNFFAKPQDGFGFTPSPEGLCFIDVAG